LSDQSPLLADPANAARTLLWDRRARDWSTEMLQLFDVPRECLPDSVPSKYDWGDLEIDGLKLPLDIVTGDQSAALFAFGDPDPTTVYANMGTGAFLQRAADNNIKNTGHLLASVVYQDEYSTTSVIEATVNGAGSAINNIAHELAIDAAELKASSAMWLEEFSGELLFLNAISGLGSPWWLADAQSGFVDGGAVAASDAEKIAAVLESIIFLMVTNLVAMSAIQGKPGRLLVTGGLGTVDPLLQRLANLSQMPVERAKSVEATARGLACLLAGVPDNWPQARIDRVFMPQTDAGLQARYVRWQQLMPQVPIS
jgi:glycerol kinase